MIVLPPLLARTWEEKSLQAGARLKDLMRQAVDGALRELRPFLFKPGAALVLVGPGHNGDDAALLGIELKEIGWDVEFLLSRSPGRRIHPDPRVKPKLWKKALVWPRKPTLFLQTKGPRLVIDGILGLGATPPPRPAEAGMISWVSQQKRGADLYVALDLPSGLDPSDGSAPGPVFPADLTLALGSVKAGCLRDSALPFVGQLRATPVDFGTSTPKFSFDFFARRMLGRFSDPAPRISINILPESSIFGPVRLNIPGPLPSVHPAPSGRERDMSVFSPTSQSLNPCRPTFRNCSSTVFLRDPLPNPESLYKTHPLLSLDRAYRLEKLWKLF
jgi:hydroxyethylthiazole kinase-like uncharacterized protein yjeF